MPALVSAKLLATYLAAAARQSAEGRGLSDRSRWAIAHAERQLQGDFDILSGVESDFDGSPRAALRTSPYPSAPSLAAIALRSAPGPASATSFEERERWAADYLSSVLTDLAALAEDRANKDAAERVRSMFAPPLRNAA